jgi:hypothetical protein
MCMHNITSSGGGMTSPPRSISTHVVSTLFSRRLVAFLSLAFDQPSPCSIPLAQPRPCIPWPTASRLAAPCLRRLYPSLTGRIRPRHLRLRSPVVRPKAWQATDNATTRVEPSPVTATPHEQPAKNQPAPERCRLLS